MGTVAVLPVKSFGLAKQRLSDAVGAEQRRELARAMVGDVLDTLSRIDGLAALVCVTAEPLAAGEARRAGARVIHDPVEAGQSAAAELGVREALALGASRALLVPGDCPALEAGEVEALLGRAASAPCVVIVPDRHGHGTNALLLSPPDAIVPSFGPGSFARHAAHARAAGATVRIAQVPSLGLDVDTPGDLAALRAALAARPGGAPRTRAVLERFAAPFAAAG